MRKTIAIALLTVVIILFGFIAVITDEQIMELFSNTYSKADSLQDTRQLFDYFEGKASIPGTFNEAEASHLKDVRNIFIGVEIAFLLSLTALLIVIPKKGTADILKKGSKWTIAALLISVIIPFRAFFNIMHRIFFPQGNWTFPAQSTLIQYYPQEFFFAYAGTIFLIIMMAALFVYLASLVIRKG